MIVYKEFIDQIINKRETSLSELVGENGLNLKNKAKYVEDLIDSLDRIFYTIDFLKQEGLIECEKAYNIVDGLFGLPTNKTIYTDEYIITLLKKVGLWETFENKQQLNTQIDKNGLNLSGGQLQRISFVNLFLRAKYFKPSLILIDEPTNNLDTSRTIEIIDMIHLLSQDSVTFVASHNPEIFKIANGILDLSLLEKEKRLNLFEPSKLEEKFV